MSWNWARLLDLTGAVGSMAAAQLGLAMAGGTLAVYFLLVSTRNIALGALGALGLLALLLCVVLAVLIRARSRSAWPLAVVAAGFLVYGVLVRKNAAVVAIPLLMLLCLRLLRARSDALHAPLCAHGGRLVRRTVRARGRGGRGHGRHRAVGAHLAGLAGHARRHRLHRARSGGG